MEIVENVRMIYTFKMARNVEMVKGIAMGKKYFLFPNGLHYLIDIILKSILDL